MIKSKFFSYTLKEICDLCYAQDGDCSICPLGEARPLTGNRTYVTCGLSGGEPCDWDEKKGECGDQITLSDIDTDSEAEKKQRKTVPYYDNIYKCPRCGKILCANAGAIDYCYHCGQHIDWDIESEVQR